MLYTQTQTRTYARRLDHMPGRVPRARRKLRRQLVPGHERSRYHGWAELMLRVFAIDVLRCPHCGGKRKPLKYITDPRVIIRILAHLGLLTQLPALAPARPPPQAALPFD
jgi:hypothetical protein